MLWGTIWRALWPLWVTHSPAGWRAASQTWPPPQATAWSWCRKTPTKKPIPKQKCLFRWAAYQSGRFPELALLYHVPNGGSRKKAEAGRFRAEGVKAGVPDLCLPVARGGFHGLYIELKRQKGSKTSDDQKRWLSELEKQGYFTALCKGWEAAAKVITDYLSMGGKQA
ncbi:VRR-NUC domain-containing protein [Neglecta sp. X4]|nr:VRR-NUC domain-containing protein [Neglectibacter sp. 59]NBJ74178.1 VRR-NUC domain-containing protein [Neglectibacter sp. X4]NCE81989.1 VRR-NUC domain-containing protein [Neglectibacter sp. X58]